MTAIEVPERIEGTRCVLRPLAAADIPAYARAFIDDPELGDQLGFEEDPDEEGLQARITMIGEGSAEGDFVELAIADPADDRLLGTVTLHSFDWRHRRTEVGFWVVPAERGAGVATEAIALCTEWAFTGLGVDRVEMTTIPTSAYVLALADRLGFRKEGVLRQRNFERGRRLDIVMLAVLQGEWVSPPN